MRSSDGFTLMEILVALTIGACVIVAAHGILVQLSDAIDTVREQAHGDDDAANGVRELRELGANLEVGPGDSLEFVGFPRRARFASWCEVPSGWLERCVVTLGFIEHNGTTELREEEPLRRSVTLLRGTGSAAFLYLNSAVHGGQWFSRWDVELSAPLALGVVIGQDTTIVPFGTRG